jgi:hypothetical protein
MGWGLIQPLPIFGFRTAAAVVIRGGDEKGQ